MCVTVVQWSRSFLNVQTNRVGLPATQLSVSLYLFFFPCLVYSFFLTLFFLLAFFFYSYCRPCWSCTWINIYNRLKSGVLFWKKGFQKLLICVLAKLTTRKKPWAVKTCQPSSETPEFFSMLVDIMTNTHSTPQTVLIYTQHPPVTHWRKLNLRFVHRLNHQYYYPKISTGFAPQK